MLLNFFLLLFIISTPSLALESRKLDDTTVPAGPTDEKCTPCNPTTPSPPPPSPPPPSPPPPPVPCPPPPPPPKKPPSSAYCPPPPPSYIYITGPPGPPGELYPVGNDFGSANKATGLPVLIGCGLLVFLVRFAL